MIAAADSWTVVITTIASVLTCFGFPITIASLFYAIIQVRKTKSAAEAAQSAARLAETAAVEESRRRFLHFVVANSHRLIHEVIMHVSNQEWSLATVRLNDLSDQIAQLAKRQDELQSFVLELREWAQTTNRLNKKEIVRFGKKHWGEFVNSVRAMIDKYYGPLFEFHEE